MTAHLTSHLTSDTSGPLPSEALLEIDGGLPGFPEVSALKVQAVDDFGIFFWMAAADAPDVSFLAVNPFIYFADYEVELTDAEEAAVRAEEGDDVIVFCFVTLDRERRTATANLLAPIVINVTRSVAVQVILDGDQDLRAPLPVPPSGAPADAVPPEAERTADGQGPDDTGGEP